MSITSKASHVRYLALLVALQATAQVAAAQDADWLGPRSRRNAAAKTTRSAERPADVLEEFDISRKDKFVLVPVLFDGVGKPAETDRLEQTGSICRDPE